MGASPDEKSIIGASIARKRSVNTFWGIFGGVIGGFSVLGALVVGAYSAGFKANENVVSSVYDTPVIEVSREEASVLSDTYAVTVFPTATYEIVVNDNVIPVTVPTEIPTEIPTETIDVVVESNADNEQSTLNDYWYDYSLKGMKYQFDAGCINTNEPYNYPACIIQRVQARLKTLDEAIDEIRILADQMDAPVYEGKILSLHCAQPALIYAPDGIDGAESIDGIDYPLEGTMAEQWSLNLVVVNSTFGYEDKIIKSSGESDLWMVYIR